MKLLLLSSSFVHRSTVDSEPVRNTDNSLKRMNGQSLNDVPSFAVGVEGNGGFNLKEISEDSDSVL